MILPRVCSSPAASPDVVSSSVAFRRLAAVGLVTVGLLLVGQQSVRAAADAFVVGSSQLQSNLATSNQNANKDGTTSASCPANSYLESVNAQAGSWGTYPAFEQVELSCRTPSGSVVKGGTAGLRPSSLALPALPGQCSGATGAITGLRVNSDRFVKDIQLRCGEIFAPSGSTPFVDSDGFQSYWILGQKENNDTQEDLTCAANQVVTGLKVGYKQDSNETAFTSLQIYCAALSGVTATKDSSSSFGTLPKTRTTKTPTLQTTVPRPIVKSSPTPASKQGATIPARSPGIGGANRPTRNSLKP